MPKEPTDHRQINTDGGTYIEGNVHADGDVVLGDKHVYTQSDAEQLDAYLQRAVTALEARIQRLVYRPDPPTEPYKFLDAFEIQDHPIFFGREDASDQLFSKVTAHRLTILHAKSGAGKSSLLQAGLGPRLVRSGRLPVYTRAYEDPVTAVKRAIASPAQGPWPALLYKLTLHEFLGLATKHLNTMQELVIMLDQFEAFFVLGPTGEHRRPFIDDLANCIEDSSLPVRIVIALRKDYYADLSAFQARLPQIFHYEMALSAMTQAEAEAAIIRPVAKLGRSVTYEPALLGMLLTDLTRGEVELPHLQIICAQLYERLAAGETTISLAAYEALDRAAGVLASYLRRVLGQFKEDKRKVAQGILVALVSSEGTKRVLGDEMLAEKVKAERSTVDGVLARLVDRRLVQRDEVEGALVYEIAHEYLVSEIQKWFDQETLSAKQADELLERELANWRVHGTLIPEERLTLLSLHRATLLVQSQDAVQCLIHSELRLGYSPTDWIELVGKELAETSLLNLLRGQDEAIKVNTVGELGSLWNFNEIRALCSHDANIQQEAAKTLGKLGDTRAVEPLIALLKDDKHLVKQAAAEALGHLGDARAVEPLIALLKDNNGEVKQTAINALSHFGDAAVKPLMATFTGNDTAIWVGAAKALDNLKYTGIVELLIARLKDADTGMRQTIATILGFSNDDRAIEPFIALLKDTDTGVRLVAMMAMMFGNLRDARAIDPLIALLKDDNSDVRLMAIYNLGLLGDARAVEPLVALLCADPNVMQVIVDTLGKLGHVHAVKPLIALLKDEDDRVPPKAIEALLRIATPEALAAVEEYESNHQNPTT